MRFIIGIDEVGRGCLAGPVVVAAVSVPMGFKPGKNAPGDLYDSKRLTPEKRTAWVEYLSERNGITAAVARVSPKEIDRLNIANAANLAALKAFQKLIALDESLENSGIFLDGGLYLGRRGEMPRALTVINGDEYVVAIQIASIFAKVARDRMMVGLARRFPAYGFDVHKGYATPIHWRALQKHGATRSHRLTFLQRKPTIKAPVS